MNLETSLGVIVGRMVVFSGAGAGPSFETQHVQLRGVGRIDREEQHLEALPQVAAAHLGVAGDFLDTI